MLSAPTMPENRPEFHVLRACGACNGTGEGKCRARCFQCRGDGDRFFVVYAHELTDADYEVMTAEETRAAHAAFQDYQASRIAAIHAADNAKLLVSQTLDAMGRVIAERLVPEWEHEASCLSSLASKGWIRPDRRGALGLTDKGRAALAAALDEAKGAELTPYLQQVARIAIREAAKAA